MKNKTKQNNYARACNALQSLHKYARNDNPKLQQLFEFLVSRMEFSNCLNFDFNHNNKTKEKNYDYQH